MLLDSDYALEIKCSRHTERPDIYAVGGHEPAAVEALGGGGVLETKRDACGRDSRANRAAQTETERRDGAADGKRREGRCAKTRWERWEWRATSDQCPRIKILWL